jgi:hypothetical protein
MTSPLGRSFPWSGLKIWRGFSGGLWKKVDFSGPSSGKMPDAPYCFPVPILRSASPFGLIGCDPKN